MDMDPKLLPLLLSVVALLVGPVLDRVAVATRARWVLSLLDGFVLAIVAGVVLGRLLPQAYAQGGWPVLLVAIGSYLAVRQLERLGHLDGHSVHSAALLLGLTGLASHEFLDGVALAAGPGERAADHLLPLAIVLHRVPIGLSIWWLVRPRLGLRAAAAVLLFVMVATVLGYWLGAQVVTRVSGPWAAAFQAAVSGALLHVLLHNDQPQQSTPTGRLVSGLGGLAGLALLLFLEGDLLPAGSGGEAGMARTLMLLLLESAPALLLAYAAAGLVGVFLPHAGVAWLRRGPAPRQAVRGVLFGLPLPLCSCGVLPVYRSLIGRGTPAVAAMAFLISGPELGLDAVLLSFPLLGLRLTVARLLCATLLAISVGILVGGRLVRQRPDRPDDGPPPPDGRPLRTRLREALSIGFADTVDHTAPFILLGVGIAAAIEPLLGRVTAIPAGWDVPLFALLGIPTYVCASAATPLVAVLLHKGISPGAALAFLLTGPATNLTTLGILAQLHGRRQAILFAAASAGITVLLGLGTNLVIGQLPGYPFHVGHGPSGLLHPICLGLLALLFLASFLRQGPRGFVAQLAAMTGGTPDHHEHHHRHEHADHDHAHEHLHPHEHMHGHGPEPVPVQPHDPAHEHAPDAAPERPDARAEDRAAGRPTGHRHDSPSHPGIG